MNATKCLILLEKLVLDIQRFLISGKVSPGPAILLQQCHLEKKENTRQRLAKQFYVKLNKTLEKPKACLMVAYGEG